MFRLINPTQHYAWGSATAIPDVLGTGASGGPVAELWMGAHPTAPSRAALPEGEVSLDRLIAQQAEVMLGEDVVARFGRSLPYLLKLIAVARPLSLQVHPALERAREGFSAENAAGIPLDDPRRSYKDANHKPELVYALTRFEALSGFRAPRRAAELWPRRPARTDPVRGPRGGLDVPRHPYGVPPSPRAGAPTVGRGDRRRRGSVPPTARERLAVTARGPHGGPSRRGVPG